MKTLPGTEGLKSACDVVIRGPGKMLPGGRKEIAQWLRGVASRLVKDGHSYVSVGNYTARYMYDPKKPRKHRNK